MNDAGARWRVGRWGLKVLCMNCGQEHRHKPEEQGRLAHRRSDCCGVKLRPRRWVYADRNRARKEILEVRAAMQRQASLFR